MNIHTWAALDDRKLSMHWRPGSHVPVLHAMRMLREALWPGRPQLEFLCVPCIDTAVAAHCVAIAFIMKLQPSSKHKGKTVCAWDDSPAPIAG